MGIWMKGLSLDGYELWEQLWMLTVKLCDIL